MFYICYYLSLFLGPGLAKEVGKAPVPAELNLPKKISFIHVVKVTFSQCPPGDDDLS
jgi:hypothetical protein